MSNLLGCKVRHKTNSACGVGRVVGYCVGTERYYVEWEFPACMSNHSHSANQLLVQAAPHPTPDKAQRIHPLHSVDGIYAYMVNTGHYYDKERCTGRTTALALEHIARSIRSPYKSIRIVDHHGTQQSHKSLRQTMQCMVNALQLDHFVFTADTITFGGRPC